MSTKKSKPKAAGKIEVKLTILGKPAKMVKVPKGTTYGEFARNLSIGSYVLCVGPDVVENDAVVIKGQHIVAMPRGKAGI